MSTLEVLLITVLMVSVVGHFFQFMLFKDEQWMKNHHAKEVQRCWRKIDRDLFKIPSVRLVKDEND